MQRPNKRKLLEISAVIATASGKFIFMDYLNLKLPFIVIAIGAWSAYVLYQGKTQPEILKHWGFRRDNFHKVFIKLFPISIIALVSFFTIGMLRDTINLTWHILPILILYPIWGTIQQFLLIALVGGNLQDMRKEKSDTSKIVLVTAMLFAIIHYPYYWLMVGTFVLALLYGHIYMQSRNLFVMGIFHGWLGALFFYTVVARDPFTEIFGKLIMIR